MISTPCPGLRHPVIGLLLTGMLAGAASSSERVVCHIDYGGERQQLVATPTDDPYAIEPVKIGSYFQFRVVAQVPPAPRPATRIFVYAEGDDGPVPVQVAEYPYPQISGGKKPGFTGWQSIYEPMRAGELQYWCERKTAGQ